MRLLPRRPAGSPGAEDRPESQDEPETPAKPSTLQGTEPMYGYIVMAELIAVAVINLTVTHGAGAPQHSQVGMSLIGLAAALGFGATILTRNRFIVGFAAIVAAFLISELPKVPNSVKPYHLFGIVIPLAYALILTQRQRKASLAQIRARKAAPVAKTAVDRRAEALARRQERRDRKRGVTAPSGPRANRRYTPPKAKRPRR